MQFTVQYGIGLTLTPGPLQISRNWKSWAGLGTKRTATSCKQVEVYEKSPELLCWRSSSL